MSAPATETALQSALPPWLADELHAVVDELAAFERPSASDGERRAAEWIAARMREHGHATRVEVERAHGGYWWPLGLLNGVMALAGLTIRRFQRSRPLRLLAAALGVGAAAAIWDDVGGGRLWFRRAALPHRNTFNVVAEAGDPDGAETIVVVAHHDAAHSGLVFHPALPRLYAERFPAQHERAQQTVPIMYATWLGPVMVALGSLLGRAGLVRAGTLLAGCAAGAMARHRLERGRARRERQPQRGRRAAWRSGACCPSARRPACACCSCPPARRSRSWRACRASSAATARRSTATARRSLCLECVGSPTLTLVEAEGMLRMRHYSEAARERLAAAAAALDVALARGLRTVARDRRADRAARGYAAATLASIDETKFPANYHWSSDTPENLDWDTMQRAFAVAERFVRADRASGTLRAGGARGGPG